MYTHKNEKHTKPVAAAQLKNKSTELIDNRPASIVQKKANATGLPDQLKSGIENLSGHSMDDVKVHYNSSQPAQLNAHAYAQGNQIHVAPGQEKHLPHEAWHVVQQKQGRVKPTLQMKGKVDVNDDQGLEREADVMGLKALGTNNNLSVGKPSQSVANFKTVQRYVSADKFLAALYKAGLNNAQIHTMMRWNALDLFGDTVPAKAVIDQYKNDLAFPPAALAPGQTHPKEILKGLEEFSNFNVPLPHGWGELNFRKGFNSLTKHGWISNNVVLPKPPFTKDIVIHVILGIKNNGSTTIILNPHATVRVKKVQDKFDQIAMLNDRNVKSEEMERLGKEGTQNSLSIGLRSDRDKSETNASANVGTTVEDLNGYFSEDWLNGIVQYAADAAHAEHGRRINFVSAGPSEGVSIIGKERKVDSSDERKFASAVPVQVPVATARAPIASVTKRNIVPVAKTQNEPNVKDKIAAAKNRKAANRAAAISGVGVGSLGATGGAGLGWYLGYSLMGAAGLAGLAGAAGLVAGYKGYQYISNRNTKKK